MLPSGSRLRSPLRVAIAYALFGALWILFSDEVAALLVPDPAAHHAVQTAKGLLFVVASAALIFALVRFELRGRSRAEAQLAASQSRLENVFDTATESIVLVDLEGRIQVANRAAAQLLGIERNELDDRRTTDPVWRIQTLDDKPLAAAEFPSAIALREDRTVRDRRLRVVRGDGTRLTLSLSAAPVRNPSGTVVGVVLTSRDITELHEAEQELRRRDAYLSVLLDSVSDIIAVLDSDSRLRFHTRSAEQILGYRGDELMDVDILELVHPEDREPVRQAFGRTLSNETTTPTPISLRLRHQDGTWRYLEVVGTRLIEPGDSEPRVILTARDVTERMRARAALAESEAQLRHAQKMEAVGRLAGGVAHDFNNIVTAILGYAEVLSESLSSRPDLVADLREIVGAAERAKTLTRQLLTFSRQEVRNPQPIDLGELVLSMDKLLRRLIGEDVVLSTDVRPNLPTIFIDPGQLEQIVLNLAVNARDAMPEGGELAIRVATSSVDGVELVRLEVRDTGVGMSEDTANRIFEPFFTTKSAALGTGLGLSIVYGIVTQAGGRVGVDSQPGTGTVFRLDFPVTRAAREYKRPSTPTGLSLEALRGRGKILIVEDEEGVRRLCIRLLRRLGYAVFEAGDGLAALDICEQRADELDLILTDVVVPELGGARLIESLRERCPTAAVIVMSGYTDDTVVRHGVGRASFRFLAKPFTPLTLAQTVADTLLEARAMEPRPAARDVASPPRLSRQPNEPER